MPPGRTVEFLDLIHGPQRFASDDIGDFVIRRADGSAAFFLSNAVDDAGMGITLVLRGDDHLANTPRQAKGVWSAVRTGKRWLLVVGLMRPS